MCILASFHMIRIFGQRLWRSSVICRTDFFLLIFHLYTLQGAIGLESNELQNQGEDCLDVCRTQGKCDFCGSKGWCCKQGFVGSGCNGIFGGRDKHKCVQKPEEEEMRNQHCAPPIQIAGMSPRDDTESNTFR